MQATQDYAKFALCEYLADYYEVPVDYIWAEFIDPHFASLEEVQFVVDRFTESSP